MGFCTVADIEAFLQITVSNAAAANRAIDEATAAIKGYCRQIIEEVEDDEYTFDVGALQWNLILPEMPVTEVSLVVEDGETLVANTDYKLANYGNLVRLCTDGATRARWKEGIQIVTVTYTHGYAAADIPEIIQAICTRAASRAYQAGLKASDLDGVPGVVSKTLGDFSVTFGSEQGGGVSEGVMGASAARLLLMSEKDALNEFRI